MKQRGMVAAFVAMAGFAGCATVDTATQVVRIGHAAPMTGQLAHLGRDNERGAQLAIDELNAKGIRISGRAVRFELVAANDLADPRTAVAVARRLVEAKVVAVVGHLNSGASIPASHIYSEAGIPTITPSATNPRLTRQGLTQTFRMVPDDAAVVATFARHAVQTLGVRRVAVIDDSTAYGQGVADTFESSARSSGAVVVGREFVGDRTTDGFDRVVAALAPLDPDMVFFGGMDAQAGPLLRQMQKQGMRARLMGGDGICSANLPRLAGGWLNNDQVWCVESGDVQPESTPALDDFRRRFADRFNANPVLYAPYTYDAVHLLVKAMIDASSTEPRVFMLRLAATSGQQGITGPLTFDSKGDVVDGAVTVFTYRDNVRTKTAVVR